MNKERIFIDESEAKAMFLKMFPNTIIESPDRRTLFWYDKETDKYYYQKPFNKRNNKVYEARGLKQYFNLFIQKIFSEVF